MNRAIEVIAVGCDIFTVLERFLNVSSWGESSPLSGASHMGQSYAFGPHHILSSFVSFRADGKTEDQDKRGKEENIQVTLEFSEHKKLIALFVFERPLDKDEWRLRYMRSHVEGGHRLLSQADSIAANFMFRTGAPLVLGASDMAFPTMKKVITAFRDFAAKRS